MYRLIGSKDELLSSIMQSFGEKVAMGWHLDGRVAACLGTHTHVPTADARVLPGGTAFISDVGMTGSRAGVIGVRREQALEAFRTQMPVRFDTADEDVWINGVVVTAYRDQVTATMVTEGGAGRFTEAVLAPEVTVAEPAMVEKATTLHTEAHRACFIANSVNFPVRHAPTVRAA